MKRILLTIAVVMMSWCVIADEWIDAKAGIKWTYWVSPNNEVEIQGISHYQGDVIVPEYEPYGDVVVPSVISGKPVTSIGGFVFSGKAIDSISMSDSIKTIGDGSFKECVTTNIHLSAALTTIGNEAFLGCQQTTGLYLPSTVTSLGIRVFEDCHALTDVSIPIGVTEVPERTFAACSALTNVVLHSGITSVGDRAFTSCTSLKEIVLPSSISSLGREAFSGCAITSIDIPEGVKSIPDGTFAGCLSLESVSIPVSVKTIGESSFMSCEKLKEVTLSESVTSIARHAFSYCKSLKTFKIPNGVTTLTDRMLGNCESLESVTIPQSVTNVLSESDPISSPFWYCKKLKKIELPAGIHGACGFQGCEALSEVNLPDGITGLDFNDCTNLQYVVMSTSISEIPAYSFQGCMHLKMITFKGNAPKVYDCSFFLASVGCVSVPEGSTGWDDDGDGKWCGIPVVYRKSDGGPYKETVDGIEWTYSVVNGEALVGTEDSRVAISTTTEGIITMPTILGGCRVAAIGDYAFGDCRKLTHITICDGVRKIGAGAFNNCYGISVTIPLSVTRIGAQAFQATGIGDGVCIIDNCLVSIGYDLASEDVVLPEGTRLIADQACSGNTMASLYIPSTVQHIGEGAFIWGNGLQTITVSSDSPRYVCEDGILSDKNVGELLWCSPSKSPVDIPANTKSIGNYAFYHRDNLYGIDIPSSVTNIGDHAFEFCENLGSVIIPSSVQRIGGSAFGGCNGLWSIAIPDGVKIIGEYAFSWTGLSSVTIGTTVEMIGGSAFSGCSGLMSVAIPSSVTNIGSYAFSNCSALTNIVFGGNAPTAGSCAFDGVASGCTATVYVGTTGWDDDGDGKWQGLTLRWIALPGNDCITFTSVGGFTLKTADTSKHWDGTLWTSTDKINWKEWSGAEVAAAQMGGAGNYYLYVRGAVNNTTITGGTNCGWDLTGTRVACTGNIETLRGATGDSPSPTPMASCCYSSMFRMAYGCLALISAPALPATNLADGCYSEMFSGCVSLTNAPALPATTLDDGCYANMFQGCTSLTQAPQLPATTLASSCYYYMFYGCTGIKVFESAPGKKWSIPDGATTASNWNSYMFAGTGGDFTGAPEVGKTYYVGAEKTDIGGGITANTYNGDCVITGEGDLTDASAIKSKGITNLVIGAGVTGIGDGVFQNWRSLIGVTIGEDCTTIGANTFKKCSYLNSVRGGKNLTTVGSKAFNFCLSLETIVLDGKMPEGLSDSIIVQTAVRPDGSTYLIPDITVANYDKVLFGKKALDDEEWVNLGSPEQPMQETGYNFFQIRLVPKGE